MGGWFRRRHEAPSPPTPSFTYAPSATECQFLEAWRFAVAAPPRPVAVEALHEGALRTVRFRSAAGGPATEFTICHAHAVEFVRVQVSERRRIVEG